MLEKPLICRRVRAYEPGPAQGFFLLKANYFPCLVGGQESGFCKGSRGNLDCNRCDIIKISDTFTRFRLEPEMTRTMVKDRILLINDDVCVCVCGGGGRL